MTIRMIEVEACIGDFIINQQGLMKVQHLKLLDREIIEQSRLVKLPEAHDDIIGNIIIRQAEDCVVGVLDGSGRHMTTEKKLFMITKIH